MAKPRPPEAAVDNIKVYSRDLTVAEVANSYQPGVFELDRPALLAHYNKRYNKDYQLQLSALNTVRADYNALAENIQEIMVMKERKAPRQAHVLLRGHYGTYGEPEPGVPERIMPFDPSWPKDRRGLAKWLTHPDHPCAPCRGKPLLANAVWHRHCEHA